MGEKANKFVAASAIIVAGITGVAQFGNGFNMLFGPPALPRCESGDASDLVKKIIADNFQVNLERLDEVSESSFDETAQKRRCTAVINAGAEGIFEIAYDLSWHNRDEKMIVADVEIVRPRT